MDHMLHVGVSILSYYGQHHGWKVPLLQLLRQILGPLGWEIAQANFTVGVWGSIPESRFDSSLAALGVPRSKFSSIHARCSRAALDMHEFMLQCYYQIRGRNAERLQVDKAMLTSTPLGGIARLSPRHVISRRQFYGASCQ